MQKIVCLMEANMPITLAAPKSSGPVTEAEAVLISGGPPDQARSSGQVAITVSADMDEREAAELVSIEDRLMAEYGPSLGPDAVMRCIADAVGHFWEARVRTYVMWLIERRATAELRHQARRAAADPADGQHRPSSNI